MTGMYSKYESVPAKRFTFRMVVDEIRREYGTVYLIKREDKFSKSSELLGKYYLPVTDEVVQAQGIEVGDVVEYESSGINSGYFVRKV